MAHFNLMTLPAILFAVVVALLLGALYHIFRGGSGWHLLMYLGLSILGFATGQIIGVWRGWNALMVGPLNLGLGSLGSLMCMIAGDWLTRGEGEGKRKGRV